MSMRGARPTADNYRDFEARASLLLEWHARSPPVPCKWAKTEVLLKASVLDEDEPLARGWVLSWLWNMACSRACMW